MVRSRMQQIQCSSVSSVFFEPESHSLMIRKRRNRFSQCAFVRVSSHNQGHLCLTAERKPPPMPNKPPWELTRPRPYHSRAAQMAAAGCGRREIAKALHVSVWQVSRWFRSPLFIDMIEAARLLQAEAKERATMPLADRVEEAAVESLNTLRQLSRFSGSSHTQLKACMTLLRLGEKRQAKMRQATAPAPESYVAPKIYIAPETIRAVVAQLRKERPG